MPWTTPTDRVSGYTVSAADWNIVEDDLVYLYGDSAWTNVTTFTNGWGTSGTIRFILLGRTVWMVGALTTAGTANTAAFTLPVGYRPVVGAVSFIVSTGAAATNLVTVNTTGTVIPLNSAVTLLHQVSFPAI